MVPIITYCAHSKCDVSSKLIHALYSCGVNNVLEWKENGLKVGIKDLFR